VLICKGAVEEVFAVCSRVELQGEMRPIVPGTLDQLRELAHGLNEDGFRVIAVAYREIPMSKATYTHADESDLVLTGYIAFLDPPKETALPAIAALYHHGVQVRILTGDNEIVTRRICRDVHLQVDRIMLGPELEALSDAELADAAEKITVFARVSPQQKARVIKALHLKGHVVGFLGDGINDGRRSRPPTWAYRSIRRWTSPKSRLTSFCWRRACWCSKKECWKADGCSATS
jgi:Mg2+-importing ATPase